MQDRWGNTPSDDAKTNDHKDIAELLAKALSNRSTSNGAVVE